MAKRDCVFYVEKMYLSVHMELCLFKGTAFCDGCPYYVASDEVYQRFRDLLKNPNSFENLKYIEKMQILGVLLYIAREKGLGNIIATLSTYISKKEIPDAKEVIAIAKMIVSIRLV